MTDTVNRQLTLTAQDASGCSFAPDPSCYRLTREPVPGGFVLCLEGRFDRPLSGQSTLTLAPLQPPEPLPCLVIENHSPFWCRPCFPEDWSQLPPQTQLLLTRREGLWHCILPLCADTLKALLQGSEQGPRLMLYSNMEGMSEFPRQPVAVHVTGEQALPTVQQAARAAAGVLGLRLRSQRPLPAPLSRLGWCSWDALHIHISHEGLLEKAREFAHLGVPVGFAILDDMWADVPELGTIPEDADFASMVTVMHRSMLNRFDGDPRRFPRGMAAAIADIRALGIPHVGVWFPTTGYWRGFDLEGEEARALAGCLGRTHRGVWHREGLLIVRPEAEAARTFFDTLCRRIRSWGADLIKVDNQGMHSCYQDMLPIGRSAALIQQSIDRAAAEHFGGALINCMGMPSECMYNRPESAVCRCSDDFIPQSREWFAKNILQCAYNGLLQGQFYINDWDMWWTDDDQAVKNSLCRAVSGGPVYVSDPIGRTRPEVLRPLIYADGSLILCDESATPTEDCLLSDPTRSGRPLKVRNRLGTGAVVAAFNVDGQDRPVTGTLSPGEALLPPGEYGWYEHFSGTGGFIARDGALPLSLADRDRFALYRFLPAEPVTPLGRTDLFLGAGAVLGWDGCRLQLREGGPLAFLSREALRVFADGRELPLSRDGLLWRCCCLPEETRLTVLVP